MGKMIYITEKQKNVIFKVMYFIENIIQSSEEGDSVKYDDIDDYTELKKIFEKYCRKNNKIYGK